MGGDISLESEYGKGSTFRMDIPQKIILDIPMGDDNVMLPLFVYLTAFVSRLEIHWRILTSSPIKCDGIVLSFSTSDGRFLRKICQMEGKVRKVPWILSGTQCFCAGGRWCRDESGGNQRAFKKYKNPDRYSFQWGTASFYTVPRPPNNKAYLIWYPEKKASAKKTVPAAAYDAGDGRCRGASWNSENEESSQYGDSCHCADSECDYQSSFSYISITAA
mgnify:CR=1 FL=1